ncbi:polyketide synthase (plasmid) [Azospirillum sp. B510]|nr:polyketide synthase [Azospirillum sp. B510]
MLAVWSCGATPAAGCTATGIPLRIEAGLVVVEELVGAVAHPLETLGRLPLPEGRPGELAILCDHRADVWLPLALGAAAAGVARITLVREGERPAVSGPVAGGGSGALLAAPDAVLAGLDITGFGSVLTWGGGPGGSDATLSVPHAHAFGDHYVLAHATDGSPRLRVLDRHRILGASGQPLPENAWGTLALSGRLPVVVDTLDALVTPEDRKTGTGLRARRRPGGLVEVDHAARRPFLHRGRLLAPRLVAAALAEAGGAGCIALCRDGGTARERLVLYGPAGALDRALDRALPAIRLPAWAGPLAGAPMPALPRLADGTVDIATLSADAPPDDWLLARAAAELGGEEQVRLSVGFEADMPADLPLPATFSAPGPTYPGDRLAQIEGPPLDPSSDTLIDRLIAAGDTDRGLILVDRTGAETRLSYRALLDHAARVAASLTAFGLRPGDELVVHCEQPADLFTGVWAAILAGVLPLPLTPPASYEAPSNPLWHLMGEETMLARRTVLAGGAEIGRVREALRARGLSAELLSIDDAQEHAPLTPDRFRPMPEALMLLTSGSTGKPKGVVLTHANLVSLSRAVGDAFGFGPVETSLNWLAIDHIGGLVQHHMRDLCRANTQIHVATDLILAEPLRMLDLIDRHRVSLLWMANFGFNMLVERAAEIAAGAWDLSCVKLWENGGEAVGFEGNQRFLALLMPHGLPGDVIKPVFGMTETSSACIGAHDLVAGRTTGVHWLGDTALDQPVRRGLPGESSSFVEVGVPFGGMRCRVVDAEGRICREGVIGRIEVSGPQVMAGYRRNPRANEEAFTDDGWLRMGDCGFVVDGRLVVTGREKEIVIINGMNHASRALEATIEAIPGIRRGACAAIGVRQTEAAGDDLVVFYALDDAAGANLDAVSPDAIAAALVAEHGLPPAVCVRLDPADFPRTAIGKIRRNILAERFLAGDHAERITLRNARLIGERQHVPSWTYVPEWVPAPLPRLPGTVGGGGEGGGILWLDAPRDAVQGLRAWSGGAFGGFDPSGTASYDPADPEDIARVVAAAARYGRLERVICGRFAGTPADTAADAALATLAEARSRWKAICRAAEALEPAPVVLFATSGAFCADGSETRIGQAVLTGLSATLGQEHPRLRVSLVDGATTLAAALAVEDGETIRVAYREGVRLVPRLRPVETAAIPEQPSPLLRKGGRYLVIGGLGGSGAHLCRHLLTAFSANVLTVGRSEINHAGGRAQAFAHLRAHAESTGGRIAYARADATDPAALARVVSTAETADGAFDAVFDLAGEGSVSERLSGTDISGTGISGTDGTDLAFARATARIRVLHAIRTACPSRPVIVFGSVNGFFGGAGFADYSAACSYQAAFAASAAARGDGPAVCVDWSMWKATGMAADASADLRALARRRGFDTLAPRQALGSLHVALAEAAPHLLVGLYAGGTMVMPHLPPRRIRTRIEATGTTDAAAVARAVGVPEDAVRCRSRGAAAEAHVPPEQADALLAIFRDVLVRPELGADDNFFGNGGDSIRAIQVVARAAAIGISFKPLDLFEHKTVRTLLSHLARDRRLARPAGQEAAYKGGPVPLPPIFAWWLAGTRSASDRNHFGMSMRFALQDGVDADTARRALLALIDRHDALRLRLAYVDGGWRLAPTDRPETSLAFAMAPAGEDVGETERRLHGLLDIGNGPVIAACLHATRPQTELVLVVHHGCVDGVSWRVIEEELTALMTPDAAPAPVAGAGYMEWAAQLARHAADADGSALAQAWADRIGGPAGRLPGPVDPRDLPDAGTCIRSMRVSVGSPLGDASLHEVLLTAVAWSLGAWMGDKRIVLDAEGHGRLDGTVSADVSRTVGWFTSITPMRLDFDTCKSPADALRVTRSALEAARGRDLEWGFLRHLGLCPREHPLAALPEQQVSFNYLGSFDTSKTVDAVVRAVPDSLGATQAPGAPRRYLIDIAAQAIRAELELSVKFTPEVHSEEEIADWLESCRDVLRGLLRGGARLGLAEEDFLAALDEVTFD